MTKRTRTTNAHHRHSTTKEAGDMKELLYNHLTAGGSIKEFAYAHGYHGNWLYRVSAMLGFRAVMLSADERKMLAEYRRNQVKKEAA